MDGLGLKSIVPLADGGSRPESQVAGIDVIKFRRDRPFCHRVCLSLLGDSLITRFSSDISRHNKTTGTMVASVLRRSGSGSAAALLAAVLLLLLGLTDHVAEAKKVKRVKAGTTYKTHDRKFLCRRDASQNIFGQGNNILMDRRRSMRILFP